MSKTQTNTNVIKFIPTEQRAIITEALNRYFTFTEAEDKENNSYLIHDILSLIGISKSPLFALIPADEINNFVHIHGVDFPKYVVTDDDKTKEFSREMIISFLKSIDVVVDDMDYIIEEVGLYEQYANKGKEVTEYSYVMHHIQRDYNRVIYTFEKEGEVIAINYHEDTNTLEEYYKSPCEDLTSIFRMTDNKLPLLKRCDIAIDSYLYAKGIIEFNEVSKVVDNGFLFTSNGHDENIISKLNEVAKGYSVSDILEIVSKNCDDKELQGFIEALEEQKHNDMQMFKVKKCFAGSEIFDVRASSEKEALMIAKGFDVNYDANISLEHCEIEKD